MPDLGCDNGPAGDLTPCGDLSCAEGRMCLGGECTEMTDLTGLACGTGAVCPVSGDGGWKSTSRLLVHEPVHYCTPRQSGQIWKNSHGRPVCFWNLRS